jgi:hypothetical protein
VGGDLVNDARRLLVDLLYGDRPAELDAAYGHGEHPERERDADVILAFYAHELAEKVRAPHPPKSYNPYSDSFEGGADWAADLIDPEVP